MMGIESINRSKLKVLHALIFATAFTVPAVQAQTMTHQLSLKEAQSLALQNAFALQYAQLDKEKSERDVKEVLASGLPQVNLIADYSQYIDIPTQVAAGDVFGFPDYLISFFGGVSQATGVTLDAPSTDPDALSEFQFGQAHTANVGVQASQLVFSGSYFVGLKASQLFLEAQDRAIDRTAEEVLRQVAEAYYLVLGAEEASKMAKEAKELLESNREEIAQLNAAGFVDALAVDRLDLALSEIETQIVNSGRQVKLAKGLLAYQIGIGLHDEIVLTQSMDALLSTGEELDWLSRAFDPSAIPGIQEQQIYFELAGLDVLNQQAKGWPQIAAFYTNQANAQRDAFNFFDGDLKWYPIQLWGLNMSMPLWTSFGGKQQVEKKKIEQERARIGLEQMTYAAEMQLVNAQANFANATEVLNNARRSEELANRIFDQTQVGFDAGVITSFEWNESRNALMESKGKTLSASLEWLNARLALQVALSAF
jgi:outer membrane protein